jgi:magnesium chelatase subunit D
VITPEDLRFKLFRRRNGILVVFVVDASGSMAMNRISLAKGALVRLLKEAYLNRDEVSLVAFRGSQGEVLLPPSSSVELARRALESLKVGDGTPLAAGLQAALNVIRRGRRSKPQRALLVLFTDGGVNVPLAPGREVWSEIEAVSDALRREGAAAVVIDTTARHLAAGRARRLATILGGRHVLLPVADHEAVHRILADAAGDMRLNR